MELGTHFRQLHSFCMSNLLFLCMFVCRFLLVLVVISLFVVYYFGLNFEPYLPRHVYLQFTTEFELYLYEVLVNYPNQPRAYCSSSSQYISNFIPRSIWKSVTVSVDNRRWCRTLYSSLYLL